MKERYCALCKCTNHTDMPKDLRANWLCPILGKKICKVDCQIEIEGGDGAPDTLAQVCKLSGKTPQEVHAMCVACKHGGKHLKRGRIVVFTMDGKGNKVTGPKLEKARKEGKAAWAAKLRWLEGKYPKSVLRRLNIQYGVKV